MGGGLIRFFDEGDDDEVDPAGDPDLRDHEDADGRAQVQLICRCGYFLS